MMLETDMSGPLAGIRVIDLTVAVLGPVATQILGDLGAEIIKIEPPEGEMMRGIGPARHPGMAAYFLNVNRNKKSLVLDLKRPAARAAVLRLAETADVLVHNMRPGAAERLGIDYAAVAGRNPRILYPRMLTPWRRPYATADGHICLLATTDRQWRSLFAAIDLPELIDDARFCSIPARTANIDALYTILGERMRTRGTSQWRERLGAA